MDAYTKLAKTLIERFENPQLWSLGTAVIISLNPFTLKYNDKIFLGREFDNLMVSDKIYYQLKNNTGERKFNIGDNIIVLPTQDGNMWYAMDRGVKI